LRWWLLSLPAGIGLATARAILKLWVGYRPSTSGVFSAGSGPSMRSAILGVMLPLDRVGEFVAASCEITHSDPKAKWGAVAVALAGFLACRREHVEPDEYLSLVQSQLAREPAGEFLELLARSIAGLTAAESTFEFSRTLCSRRGVSGYVYQTVPVCIHAWLRHQRNYRVAIENTIRCGGDADTTAAIVGGIVGASVGPAGIPVDWQKGLRDWPLSLDWMGTLAVAATNNAPPPQLPLVGRVARNLVFLPIVLAHGFRRLAPPY
jgi:ADP-ribosylglycohydrolase